MAAGERPVHPHLHRSRRVRVADGIVGYADGERVGPLPLDCEVVPGALRLLGAGGAVSVTS
jgi:diacylglycerol kinase (ATP)